MGKRRSKGKGKHGHGQEQLGRRSRPRLAQYVVVPCDDPACHAMPGQVVVSPLPFFGRRR